MTAADPTAEALAAGACVSHTGALVWADYLESRGQAPEAEAVRAWSDSLSGPEERWVEAHHGSHIVGPLPQHAFNDAAALPLSKFVVLGGVPYNVMGVLFRQDPAGREVTFAVLSAPYRDLGDLLAPFGSRACFLLGRVPAPLQAHFRPQIEALPRFLHEVERGSQAALSRVALEASPWAAAVAFPTLRHGVVAPRVWVRRGAPSARAVVDDMVRDLFRAWPDGVRSEGSEEVAVADVVGDFAWSDWVLRYTVAPNSLPESQCVPALTLAIESRRSGSPWSAAWFRATPEERRHLWGLTRLAGIGADRAIADPVTAPRGIPSDASPSVRAAWAAAVAGGQGGRASWLTTYEYTKAVEAADPGGEALGLYHDAAEAIGEMMTQGRDCRVVFWLGPPHSKEADHG